MILRVLEIFDSLQGEGYWTGTPMTFVRVAGCNAPELGLGCTAWCDTQESWGLEGGRDLEVAEVVVRAGLPRLCLTGGEPLLQLEGVTALAGEARVEGIKVHLETNGTVAPPTLCADAWGASTPQKGVPNGRVFDWTTVSPKPPRYMVAQGWDSLVDELKFIVDDQLEAATVERVAADYPGAVVCIQPAWGSETAKRAADMVMAHPDWRLSLQMHKYLSIV